jgi:hypothetical protein
MCKTRWSMWSSSDELHMAWCRTMLRDVEHYVLVLLFFSARKQKIDLHAESLASQSIDDGRAHLSSNSWYTVEPSCTIIIVVLVMCDNAPKLLGIRTRNQFVSNSFNACFQDARLHDLWWQAHTLVDEINTRYQLEGNIEAGQNCGTPTYHKQ